MKKMKLITVATLALAAVGFASNSASAANVSTGSQDLILGFEIIGINGNAPTGQGVTSDLEFDLGAASKFVPSFSYSQAISADLTSVYGAGWATRSDLVWGVGGVTSVDPTTAANFELTSSNKTVKVGSNSQQATPYSAVQPLAAGLNGQTALSNANGGVVPTGNSNSFEAERTVGGSNDFNVGYTTGGTLAPGQSEVSGGPIGSIDLFNFTASSARTAPTAVDEGTFALASNGTFTFNAVAAPEPSAYALGICAVLLFVVLRRRSSIA